MLAALPEKFDTPMFWEKDEIKELQGTAVVGLSITPAVQPSNPTHYPQTRLGETMLSVTTTAN